MHNQRIKQAYLNSINIWQSDLREKETHWDILMNTFFKQQNLEQMTTNLSL